MHSANRLQRSSRVIPIGVFALVFACVAAVDATPRQAAPVPEELLEKAQRLGAVRINVQVRVEAGADELSEVRGAAYRVLRELRGLPLLGLEASYGALIKLNASPEVLRVEEDRLDRQQGQG